MEPIYVRFYGSVATAKDLRHVYPVDTLFHESFNHGIFRFLSRIRKRGIDDCQHIGKFLGDDNTCENVSTEIFVTIEKPHGPNNQ